MCNFDFEWDYCNTYVIAEYKNKNFEIEVDEGTITIDLYIFRRFDYDDNLIDQGIEISDIKVENCDLKNELNELKDKINENCF